MIRSARITDPRDRFAHHSARIIAGLLDRFRPDGRLSPDGGEDVSQLTCLYSQEIIYGLAAMSNMEHPDNPLRDDYVVRNRAIGIGDYLASRFGTTGGCNVQDGNKLIESCAPPHLLHYWILAADELADYISPARADAWEAAIRLYLFRIKDIEEDLWRRAGETIDSLPFDDGLRQRFLASAILSVHGRSRGEPEIVAAGDAMMTRLLGAISPDGYALHRGAISWYDTLICAYGIELYERATMSAAATGALERIAGFLIKHQLYGGAPNPTLDYSSSLRRMTLSSLHSLSGAPAGVSIADELSSELSCPSRQIGRAHV